MFTVTVIATVLQYVALALFGQFSSSMISQRSHGPLSLQALSFMVLERRTAWNGGRVWLACWQVKA